jgi:hypothetical protein
VRGGILGGVDGGTGHALLVAARPSQPIPAVRAAVGGSGLLVALIAVVDDGGRTQALGQWFGYALGGILLWFVFGPAWSLVFFRREMIR